MERVEGRCILVSLKGYLLGPGSGVLAHPRGHLYLDIIVADRCSDVKQFSAYLQVFFKEIRCSLVGLRHRKNLQC